MNAAQSYCTKEEEIASVPGDKLHIEFKLSLKN